MIGIICIEIFLGQDLEPDPDPDSESTLDPDPDSSDYLDPDPDLMYPDPHP